MKTKPRRRQTAILAITGQGVALDARWGDVQFIQTAAGARLPIAGGEEFEGVMNKTSPRLPTTLADGRYVPAYGASYLQLVTLGDGPRQAQGLLVYSPSTDPRSPHREDQAPLWSRGAWRSLP